jgi:hypothetical protein
MLMVDHVVVSIISLTVGHVIDMWQTMIYLHITFDSHDLNFKIIVCCLLKELESILNSTGFVPTIWQLCQENTTKAPY